MPALGITLTLRI